MERLALADRLLPQKKDVRFIRYAEEPVQKRISNWWDGLGGASDLIYVVQTNETIVQRCILMTTDPGDLVLDPTCGSGTTAFVSEQWGRRWITIDTSRVALALARQRLMAARLPCYMLKDTPEGVRKEADIAGHDPDQERLANVSRKAHRPSMRQGFVLRRFYPVTSGSIANNAEIDTIWETSQQVLEPLLDRLNEWAQD
jgi:adenine-specific DNA-methyltransferase